MRVYHLTFGRVRLKSILKKGLLPSSSKVLGEEFETTEGRIFFGRTLEESRQQLDLTDHPVRGDEIILILDLPDNYSLYEDEWGYLYGTERVPPSRILRWINISRTLKEKLGEGLG